MVVDLSSVLDKFVKTNVCYFSENVFLFCQRCFVISANKAEDYRYLWIICCEIEIVKCTELSIHANIMLVGLFALFGVFN